MRFSLLILTVIGFSSAVPLDRTSILDAFASNDIASRNSVIEAAVWELIERLREIIRNGGEIIPVLDPFDRESIKIDGEQFGQPGAHLHMENVHANGLSHFHTDHMSVTRTSLMFQRYRVDLGVLVPIIRASVEKYDMIANIWGSDMYGTGDAGLTISGIHFDGYLNIGVTINNGIFLHIIDNGVHFTLSEFKPEITGIFHNDATSQYVNELLEEMVPYLVRLHQETINDILARVIRYLGNRYLEGRDISDLLFL